jgi:hypothetical protein
VNEEIVGAIREVLQGLSGPIDREHYNDGQGRAIGDCDAVAVRVYEAIAPLIKEQS